MEHTHITRYRAYKDSGVEWLGEIPAHWEIRRIKTLAVLNPSKYRSGYDKKSTEYAVFLPMEKVSENWKIDCSIKQPIASLWDGFTYFEKKDIILAKITPCFENGKGAYLDELETEIGFGSTEFHVLRAKEVINSKFLSYMLRANAFTKPGKEFMIGSAGQQRVPLNYIANYYMGLPPLSEQTRIAEFLDRKTALIDRAIAQKERLIALLRERRQILIHTAVTRGLNPDVPLKDSGVAWIGEIPAHWEVKKLKYLGGIKYGLGQPPKEKEDGLPLIRATNIERGKIVEKGFIYVDPEDVPWEREPELKENDIIVVRSGAYTADSAIIPKHYAGAIAGYDMVITPKSITPLFLSYALLSKYVLYDQLYLLRMRAAQPHLNAEELGETLILFPPLFEQNAISEYIETANMKVEAAITNQQAQIEKLQEYKATLINSAVTGKMRV